jgi:dethiobiotin synthetase
VRGVFVTGTDTGVGKTVLAAAICAALAARGVRVRAFKPVVTGTDEPPAPDERGVVWAPDHELLAAAAGGGAGAGADPPGAASRPANGGDEGIDAGTAPEGAMRHDAAARSGAASRLANGGDEGVGTGAAPQGTGGVAPFTFGPAVSPHLAGELAGTRLDPEALVAAAREAGDGAEALVCEGVGGLLVPLAGRYLVRDLAAALGLPVVVAARPGLGTINHSLLTVEAARAAGLDVRAVVMTPWPAEPSVMEESNRRTVAGLAGVPVATLPATRPDGLAAAGAALPLDAWLGAPS